MAYVKVTPPSVVYHLTRMENLDSILDDGQIRRFEDSECWFCESLGARANPTRPEVVSFAAIQSSGRRTMSSLNSLPANRRITGIAGIRRSLPAARKNWCRRRRNFQD